MILNATRGEYRPLIQVVDNIERNHKLGLVFEFAVGKGKAVSLHDRSASHCRGHLRAIVSYILLRYMKSDAFSPYRTVGLKELDALFHADINQRQIIGVKNESDYTVEGGIERRVLKIKCSQFSEHFVLNSYLLQRTNYCLC